MKTNISPRPELYDPELVLAAVRKALCFCFISNGAYCFFSEEQLALVRDCYIREYFEVSHRGYQLLRFLERHYPDHFDFAAFEDQHIVAFSQIGKVLHELHREAVRCWVEDNGIRPQLSAGCRVKMKDGLEEVSATILGSADKDGFYGCYWVRNDRSGDVPMLVRYEDRSLKPETPDTGAA